MRSVLGVIVVGALVAAACTNVSEAGSTSVPAGSTTTTVVEPGPGWWSDRVFYEVFVRSFKDSDGDGIGDLQGLIASLDYLNDGDPTTTSDLGVTGLWLMPIFPSPSYHGYDVTDYRTVNPDYGSLDDFRELIDAAHARGIAVIIDLVINHTSREHPWFEAARSGDLSYEDWYIWSDSDPLTTGPWGQDVWHEADGRYYFGLFWEGMPDLNLTNPEVTEELHDIARFWLEEMGVDGFRLDAARHLIEKGEVMADTAETIAWLEDFNDFVDTVTPDALVLGEVWSPTLTVASYLPEALDLAFEFDLASAGGRAVAESDAAVLDSALERVLGAHPEGHYAVFLTNHDMNRIMSEVGGDVALAKAAATWMLTSPGVPFVYYGEEVGLQGTKPDERIRTPMPWTGVGPGVGFTTGSPWEPADPGFVTFNVADEDTDSASLLNHYRQLIQFRNTSDALRSGAVIDVETGTSELFAYLRSTGSDHVLVVINLSAEPVTDYALDLAVGPLEGIRGVVSVVGPGASPPTITPLGGFLDYKPVASIPGYGGLVLQLTSEEQPPPPPTTTTTLRVIDATDLDVDAVMTFLRTVNTEPSRWLEHVAPDATISDENGTYSLFEPVPPELAADWDADGVITVADIVTGQLEFAFAIGATGEAECHPVGPVVECVLAQNDVFLELAGLDPVRSTQTFTVSDGVITNLGNPVRSGDVEAVDSAWAQQLAAFEHWVYDTHAEEYESVFTGPCCTGDPETLILTPATKSTFLVLLEEWAP